MARKRLENRGIKNKLALKRAKVFYFLIKIMKNLKTLTSSLKSDFTSEGTSVSYVRWSWTVSRTLKACNDFREQILLRLRLY